jgi:hypothetical protein
MTRDVCWRRLNEWTTWGELTKNCISMPVRCTMFWRTKDVSGPRHCTEMSMPEKVVSTCMRLIVSMEPGQMRYRWVLEKSVLMIFCFSVEGRV